MRRREHAQTVILLFSQALVRNAGYLHPVVRLIEVQGDAELFLHVPPPYRPGEFVLHVVERVHDDGDGCQALTSHSRCCPLRSPCNLSSSSNSRDPCNRLRSDSSGGPRDRTPILPPYPRHAL